MVQMSTGLCLTSGSFLFSVLSSTIVTTLHGAQCGEERRKVQWEGKAPALGYSKCLGSVLAKGGQAASC